MSLKTRLINLEGHGNHEVTIIRSTGQTCMSRMHGGGSRRDTRYFIKSDGFSARTFSLTC